MHCKIKLFSVFILSSVLVASVAASNEEIQRMIQQGSFEKALVLAEEQLSVNPDEIQTLFLKGLILARMDRLKESEAVFIGLTEKHPELPEPYNNLAVVYAASGDYDKAEEALRQAINTHPSYATAHENLGDIYAKMASQAYNNALKLDSDNQETREKLSMISDLISVPEAVAVAQSVPKTAPTSVKKEIKSEPTLAKFEPEPTNLLEPPFDRDAARKDAESRMQEEKKQLEEIYSKNTEEIKKLQEMKARAEAQIKKAREQLEKQASESRRELDEARNLKDSVKEERKKLEKEAEQQRAKQAELEKNVKAKAKALLNEEKRKLADKIAQNNEELEQAQKEKAVAEVITAVNSWANAWSAKDVDNYIKSYSAKFVPPNKLTLSKWQEQRRLRLTKPSFIKVILNNVKVEILSQDLALVRFVQIYQSDNYKDQVNKQLLLNNVDGDWLISKEESS